MGRGFTRKDVTAWLLGKADEETRRAIEEDLARGEASLVGDYLAWRAGHRPRQPSPVLVREYLDSLSPEFVRALNRMGEESELGRAPVETQRRDELREPQLPEGPIMAITSPGDPGRDLDPIATAVVNVLVQPGTTGIPSTATGEGGEPSSPPPPIGYPVIRDANVVLRFWRAGTEPRQGVRDAPQRPTPGDRPVREGRGGLQTGTGAGTLFIPAAIERGEGPMIVPYPELDEPISGVVIKSSTERIPVGTRLVIRDLRKSSEGVLVSVEAEPGAPSGETEDRGQDSEPESSSDQHRPGTQRE